MPECMKVESADDSHGLALGARAPRLEETMEAGNGRAHADGGINGGQGRHGPQGIAPNVPQHRQLVFCQGVEKVRDGDIPRT